MTLKIKRKKQYVRPDPPLKWHGGKHYLAQKIIDIMPPRCRRPDNPEPGDYGWLHYVEPYFGGGSVLLANDPDGISEVVNDIDGQLTNFWQVVASEKMFPTFMRLVDSLPFSEVEYRRARHWLHNFKAAGEFREQMAAAFFVSCRQSMSGRLKTFTPLTKNRTRRRMNAEVSAWMSAVDGLEEVHERMKRVVVLEGEAIDVIQKQDGPRTLFYLDPPYLHETRTAKDVYEHEMSVEQHQRLLTVLSGITGRFMLSGYRSDLYDKFADLHGWERRDFEAPNNAAGGAEKRRMVECVWMNTDLIPF